MTPLAWRYGSRQKLRSIMKWVNVYEVAILRDAGHHVEIVLLCRSASCIKLVNVTHTTGQNEATYTKQIHSIQNYFHHQPTMLEVRTRFNGKQDAENSRRLQVFQLPNCNSTPPIFQQIQCDAISFRYRLFPFQSHFNEHIS